MNNRTLVAGIVIVLGVLMAVTTRLVLPPCSSLLETASGMLIPMKCHWSSQMAAGLGLFIAFEGLLLGVMKSVFARLGLSMVVIATAVLAITVPTILIGVCAGGTMPCRTGMLPAIFVICVLLLLAGAGNILYLHGHKKSQAAFQS